MLLNCTYLRRTWELLQQKIPKRVNCSWLQYAIGINDTCTIMMVKAEVLKYLMHFKDLEPENILNKTVAYLKTVNHQNREIANL
jgi:pantothenate kinase